MNPETEIDRYLKTLFSEANLIDLLQNKELDYKQKLLELSKDIPQLFQKTFCFWAFGSSQSFHYPNTVNSGVLCLLRLIKNSDLAILISLIRITSQSPDDFYPKTTIQIYVQTFNFLKTVGHINNYALIAGKKCRLIDCQTILRANCSKTHLGPWFQKFKDWLEADDSNLQENKEIVAGLLKLEEQIRWWAENNLTTVKRNEL